MAGEDEILDEDDREWAERLYNVRKARTGEGEAPEAQQQRVERLSRKR